MKSLRFLRWFPPIFFLSAFAALVRTDANEKTTEHRNGGAVLVSAADMGPAILKQGGSAVGAADKHLNGKAVGY